MIDPLLDPGEDGLLDDVVVGPVRILITLPYHARSAEPLAARYGATIHGHPNVSPPGCRTARRSPPLAPGAALDGVEAFAVGSPPRTELPLHLAAERRSPSATSSSSTRGPARLGPGSADRQAPGLVRAALQADAGAHRRRACRDVERVLVTHGQPVLEGGTRRCAKRSPCRPGTTGPPDGPLRRRRQGEGPRRRRLRRPRLAVHRAAQGRPCALDRAVPVPRRALAVVRDRAVPEAVQVLRVRRGRRPVPLRRAQGGPRLPRRAGVPRRPRGDRARARGGGPAGGRAPPLPRPPAGAAGAHGDVLLALPVGLGRGRQGARLPGRARPGRGVLREFRVGYSPKRWDVVLLASRRAGFSNKELYDAGLAQRSKSTNGLLDRFRGRVMFPLADRRGRVLGFGARRLDDEDRGPEVPELRRRRHLPQGPEPLRARTSPGRTRPRRGP